MTSLVEDVIGAKQTIYKYAAIVAISGATAASIYGWYLIKRVQHLEGAYQQLEIQKQIKDAEIKTKETIIEASKKAFEEKEKLMAEKDAKIAYLNKQVDNLEKTKHIEMAKDAQDVKDKIFAMYSDKEVEFTKENKYLLTAPTTFNLIYDAESWKVNGLTLTKNNDTLFKSNLALRDGISFKDSLIIDLKKIQQDQDKLVVSLKDKDKISNEQIKNLQETLTLTNSKTTYKIVGSFVAGLAVYYILDKVRK